MISYRPTASANTEIRPGENVKVWRHVFSLRASLVVVLYLCENSIPPSALCEGFTRKTRAHRASVLIN